MVEDVVTLEDRFTVVFCGYMPYGWLGPAGNGLSDRVIVAKDAVELIEVRCNRDVACELVARAWVLALRPGTGALGPS